MEITGRLTNDAQVKTLKDNRQVVTFSIAINDYFKTKDGEKKEETTFINCSYWISTRIANSLKKGCIVSLFGRVGLNAYKDMSGDYHSHLTFHTNHIKVIAKGGKAPSSQFETAGAQTTDDLPF